MHNVNHFKSNNCPLNLWGYTRLFNFDTEPLFTEVNFFSPHCYSCLSHLGYNSTPLHVQNVQGMTPLLIRVGLAKTSEQFALGVANL